MSAYWSWLHLTHRVGILAGDLTRTEGAEVALSLVRVQAIDGPEAYVVEKGAIPVRVVGPSVGLSIDEELNLGGTWSEADDAVRATWVESAAERRRAKRLLGVLGLIVAAILWGGAVRGRPGQWRLDG